MPQRPDGHEYERADHNEDEVRGDSGQGDDHVSLHVVAIIARIDGDRLGGTEDEGRVRENEDRRQDDRHERIDMLDGVQREAAEHVRRRVALPIRRFRVGILVRHDRKQQYGNLQEDVLERHGLR